ncbi:hypothetical protein Tco_0026307 [Tanacetum coccineum]
MKNLEDTDNFGDQFLYDKPTKDDQEKSNVVDESDSTIPNPIYQTVTSTPPKYYVLPGSESIKNQESKKSPKEIIRIKREQGEEKQESPYSIRSTNKVALEEFDLKTLIANEDAMDKEVAVMVKDHKRKHDSDDDDNEGPSAGSNQGRSAKRRRPESAASGSAQPPPKDDDQSSKKLQESDASASKQHPTLTSTGWQITDTRDDVINSLMHMLPNNIQFTDTSLMHMLNLNSSPHKEDSLVLLSEIPLLCQRRGLLIRLRSSREHLKMEMEIPCSNKIKFITACSFSNDSFEDIMKAQVSVIKASATLNIQAFKIKKSVSISFRMTQVHKMAKDHMMMIRDYDWMMISKKLKDHIQVKLKPKSLKFTASDSQDTNQ